MYIKALFFLGHLCACDCENESTCVLCTAQDSTIITTLK